MSTRNIITTLVNRIGDLSGNGITEASLALAVKNDRLSLVDIVNRMYVKVYPTSQQIIYPNSPTGILFDAELEKTDSSMHSNTTNSFYLHAPKDGIYNITGLVQWSGTASCDRLIELERNVFGESRVETISQYKIGIGTTSDFISSIVVARYRLKAGDDVYLQATHTNSSSISLIENSRFEMIWERP